MNTSLETTLLHLAVQEDNSCNTVPQLSFLPVPHVTILSFLLLNAHLRLASPYLHFLLFLRNTFHLNAASLLCAAHGPIVPFPLTFYGRLFSHLCCLNAALCPSIAQPSIPFMLTLALVLWTLLGLCAEYSPI